MRIGVDGSIFARFPGYRRAIVVARGLDNHGECPGLAARLEAAQERFRTDLGASDWRESPRVAAWLDAFRALGVGPGSRPPSIAALSKRVAKGGRLPYVNNVVALMNTFSLEHLVPCGGDDLATVGAEILLRPATGAERYVPLGSPDSIEHPDVGEVVYVDTASSTVLCRCWCWRNGDTTRLTEETDRVCLNLDLMAPAVDPSGDEALARTLADDLRRYCGGEATWHLLTPDRPVAELDL